MFEAAAAKFVGVQQLAARIPATIRGGERGG